MRRKVKKKRKHPPKTGRWLVFLLLIAFPLFHLSQKVYKLVSSVQEEKIQKKEILILEAENEVLKNRINEYKKGTLLEAKARDDLGMIKKDEKIYIILGK